MVTMAFRGLETSRRAAPAAQPVCSTSYAAQPRHVPLRRSTCSRQHKTAAVGTWRLVERKRQTICCAAASPEPSEISGYTPANYIAFSEDPTDYAPHTASVVVNAPASVCFGLWNDWNRLVDFFDLVAQIGLDPNNPEMALFQCFYRHGMLPVMEIVFVLQRGEVVQDKSITFESVWGMPMSGRVEFTEQPSGSTLVELSFGQAIPTLLVDMQIGAWGMQNSLRPILADNMAAFKRLAEAAAQRGPDALPPRQETGEREIELFDEDAELQEMVDLLDEIDLDELEREVDEFDEEYAAMDEQPDEDEDDDEGEEEEGPQGAGGQQGEGSEAEAPSAQDGSDGPSSSSSSGASEAAAQAVPAARRRRASGEAEGPAAQRADEEAGAAAAPAPAAPTARRRSSAARGTASSADEDGEPSAPAKRKRSTKPRL